jgi:hypothetical protein
MDSHNSISKKLDELCATMEPRPFVYKNYVCYNGCTTVPQYVDRCYLRENVTTDIMDGTWIPEEHILTMSRE